MDGALSIFRDLRENYFSVGGFEKIPWDFKGDLKDPEYSYNDINAAFSGGYEKAYIDKVTINSTNSVDNEFSEFNIGYAEFSIIAYRFPRK